MENVELGDRADPRRRAHRRRGPARGVLDQRRSRSSSPRRSSSRIPRQLLQSETALSARPLARPRGRVRARSLRSRPLLGVLVRVGGRVVRRRRGERRPRSSSRRTRSMPATSATGSCSARSASASRSAASRAARRSRGSASRGRTRRRSVSWRSASAPPPRARTSGSRRCAASSAASATAAPSSCNYLLVQRGTTDDMRGRALTLVMSATYALTGARLRDRRRGRST